MLSGRYTAVSGHHRLDLRVDFDGPRAQHRISGDLFAALPGQLETHFFSFVTAALIPPALQGPVEVSHHPQYKSGHVSLMDLGPTSAQVTLSLSVAGAPAGDVFSFHTTRVDEFLRAADVRVYALSGLLPPDAPELDPVHRPSAAADTAARVTLGSVLEENGFRVRKPTEEILPSGAAGADEAWSDAELHEALVALREPMSPSPQDPWPFDLLVAPRSDRPRVLGVLFDTGTAGRAAAVFYDAIRSHQKVADRSGPFAREYLFTCVHEMGHLLRLPHAWVPFGGVGPAERADHALSFMAYPDNYALGYTRFYARFPFEFRAEERLHLRHAAWPDIWPGGASPDSPAFLLDSGQGRKRLHRSRLRLELRPPRGTRFRFGEPVHLELKLENVSRHPVRVAEDILDFAAGGIQVAAVRKGGKKRPRLLRPVLLRDRRGKRITLGASGPLRRALYGPIDLTFGRRGFNFLEPGSYSLTAATRLPEGELVTSAPLTIEVERPTRAEERAAAESLSPPIGLALALGGDPQSSAMSRLREIAERSPLAAIVPWAALRLGDCLGAEFKRVTRDRVRVVPPDPTGALRWLAVAQERARANRSFSKFDWSRLLEIAATCHARLGRLDEAEKTVARLSRFARGTAVPSRRRRAPPFGLEKLRRRIRILGRLGSQR